MTTLREAAQQALEALELVQTDVYWELNSPTLKFLRKAEKSLRAALEEPVQEPVAWRVMLPDGYQFVYDERMLRVIDEGIHATRQPLYTSPPQRKPLTDEEIDRITDAQWASNNHKPVYAAHRAYARAIVRAAAEIGRNMK